MKTRLCHHMLPWASWREAKSPWKTRSTAITRFNTHTAVCINLNPFSAHFTGNAGIVVETISEDREELQIFEIAHRTWYCANDLIVVHLIENQLRHRSDFRGDTTGKNVMVKVDKSKGGRIVQLLGNGPRKDVPVEV